MSQEPLEIVRRMFDQASRVEEPGRRRFNALDLRAWEPIFSALAPDVEFNEDPRFPEAGLHRGIGAVRSYLARFTESFDEFSFEVEGFVDLGKDRVLALLRLTTRGIGSGVKVEVEPGWIVAVRNGVVVRVDAFIDRAEALEAAGLSE
jgi:ketosteroid isomerase-like protein